MTLSELCEEVEKEGIERTLYGKTHAQRIKINRLIVDALNCEAERIAAVAEALERGA